MRLTLPRILKSAGRSIVNKLGYEITNLDPIIAADGTFMEIYKKCRGYTMTSKERMYCLYMATNYVIDVGISGDFVECGVWKGGSIMVIAYTLIARNEKNRRIFAYDTFEGMSSPTNVDFRLSNRSPATAEWRQKNQGQQRWLYASLAEVKKNVLSTGFPESRVVFVKGKVEDTIPATVPEEISLLRLDTDWYESTRHELANLFPLLRRGGVLIIDDYGYWSGAKKATDEYISKNHIPMFLSRIDDTGRVAIKP
jgi:O-methyltransferase